ncbi:MAG TPA: hypothetical protein VK463_19700 [Desulfomonilaceae bacterium]|nr:hypothetical protein [Desulfomonilaceae bacterium]
MMMKRSFLVAFLACLVCGASGQSALAQRAKHWHKDHQDFTHMTIIDLTRDVRSPGGHHPECNFTPPAGIRHEFDTLKARDHEFFALKNHLDELRREYLELYQSLATGTWLPGEKSAELARLSRLRHDLAEQERRVASVVRHPAEHSCQGDHIVVTELRETIANLERKIVALEERASTMMHPTRHSKGVTQTPRRHPGMIISH